MSQNLPACKLTLVLLCGAWRTRHQGSTLLYGRYLEPLFLSHERDVDAYLGDLRYTVGGWLQKAFAAVWTLARERLNVSRSLSASTSARSRSLDADDRSS